MTGDFVWGEKKVCDLIDGAHLEDLGDGVLRSIESRGLTWYEQRCKMADAGDPLIGLDAIQLDMAVEQMLDMPMRAAVQLRMLGWQYADIGAVVRDRRRRTGAALVEDGVASILRHERKRSNRG
jgi:hypothetical protein